MCSTGRRERPAGARWHDAGASYDRHRGDHDLRRSNQVTWRPRDRSLMPNSGRCTCTCLCAYEHEYSPFDNPPEVSGQARGPITRRPDHEGVPSDRTDRGWMWPGACGRWLLVWLFPPSLRDTFLLAGSGRRTCQALDAEPLRRLPDSPLMPSPASRFRYFDTTPRCAFSRAAIAALTSPSAVSSTIWTRITSTCGARTTIDVCHH
jgi:hypothetical protein